MLEIYNNDQLRQEMIDDFYQLERQLRQDA